MSFDWGDTFVVLGECRSVTAGQADLKEVKAAAFASLFREVFDDVLQFCARRVALPQAEDIAAETMTGMASFR